MEWVPKCDLYTQVRNIKQYWSNHLNPAQASTLQGRARASRRRLVLTYYFAMALTLRDCNTGAFGNDKLLDPKPGF